jgi:fructose-specific phosphotransferase system IIA component
MEKMKINELMLKDAMIMDLQATDKKGAIDEMVAKLYAVGRISDIEVYKEGILAREAQTSTGLGDGIAMPHAKNSAVKEATVLFAKSNAGVDYEALDGQPTYLFFMITGLKVVTNSVKHASLLIDHGIDTMILGGTIKISTNAVLGINAGEQLRKLRFNRCFMGMNGAHSEAGFTTPDPEEALIKQIALEHSQQAYVLLDHSKFQQTTFAQVAFIEGATIITDYCPKNYLAKFRAKTTIMEVIQ